MKLIKEGGVRCQKANKLKYHKMKYQRLSFRLVSIVLLLSICCTAKAQRTQGTFLFNLVEIENSGNLITVQDIKSKNIKFLSSDSNSVIKYDSLQKAFSFTTRGYEKKFLGIVYEHDTIFLTYPTYPTIATYFLKTPIPLNGNSFSFYSEQDANNSPIYPNNNGVLIDNLYYNEILSERYQMKEETKNILKRRLNQTLKFRE